MTGFFHRSMAAILQPIEAFLAIVDTPDIFNLLSPSASNGRTANKLSKDQKEEIPSGSLDHSDDEGDSAAPALTFNFLSLPTIKKTNVSVPLSSPDPPKVEARQKAKEATIRLLQVKPSANKVDSIFSSLLSGPPRATPTITKGKNAKLKRR